MNTTTYNDDDCDGYNTVDTGEVDKITCMALLQF